MAAAEINDAVKTVIDEMFTIPGIKAGQAFGYPAYKINGKVFAFLGSKGLILKLPAERVKSMMAEHSHMQMMEVEPGVFWREWLSIQHDDPQAFRQYQGLAEESISFVGQPK